MTHEAGKPVPHDNFHRNLGQLRHTTRVFVAPARRSPCKGRSLVRSRSRKGCAALPGAPGPARLNRALIRWPLPAPSVGDRRPASPAARGARPASHRGTVSANAAPAASSPGCTGRPLAAVTAFAELTWLTIAIVSHAPGRRPPRVRAMRADLCITLSVMHKPSAASRPRELGAGCTFREQPQCHDRTRRARGAPLRSAVTADAKPARRAEAAGASAAPAWRDRDINDAHVRAPLPAPATKLRATPQSSGAGCW